MFRLMSIDPIMIWGSYPTLAIAKYEGEHFSHVFKTEKWLIIDGSTGDIVYKNPYLEENLDVASVAYS